MNKKFKLETTHLVSKMTNCFNLLLLGFCGTLLIACSSVDLATRSYNSNDFYFISKPNQRQLDPDSYFKHEYKYINNKDGLEESEVRPKHLTGLAFSGGGIRSAAFQLGILSGLHSNSRLSDIDYISSVSGGSWANGAYWSTKQSDDEFFSCLDAFAKDGYPKAGCKSPYKILRNTQKISWLPIDDDGWKQRKKAWEEDIIKSHLGDCNIAFDLPEKTVPCLTTSNHRPYPIFNSTHSSSEEEADANHYPFQSTPDYQGTIIDDKDYQGFFLKSGSKNFVWENRNWKRWLPGGEKDYPGEVLSLMLAHSSGVVGSKKPFLLQYNFHAHYHDNETEESVIKGLRRIYNLADGGKADNLGLLPLFERGVDTIIVSQMGKEGEDFGDIKLAAEQANRLFGCTFKSDWKRDIPLVVTTPYDCPNVLGGKKQGTLILIRPTVENVRNFLKDLEKENPSLYSKLIDIDAKEKPKDRFPETPTFRDTYPPELIRAYYLLGSYLTESLNNTFLGNDLQSLHLLGRYFDPTNPVSPIALAVEKAKVIRPPMMPLKQTAMLLKVPEVIAMKPPVAVKKAPPDPESFKPAASKVAEAIKAPPESQKISIKVFYGTDRAIEDETKPNNFFGSKRGDLVFGYCEVSIPRDHKIGELESPKWFKGQFSEDVERDVVLLKVNRQYEQDFFASLRSQIKNTKGKQAFVFIHGYNVNFADAARRTAQMAYDLSFDGTAIPEIPAITPILFSWASENKLLSYVTDANNQERTVSNLQKFLLNVSTRTEAKTIYIIAHSMGTRVLSQALHEIVNEQRIANKHLFKEIILAAPDIDAEIFKNDLLPKMQLLTGRITLYASSKDEALNASKKLNGYPRAGDANSLLVAPGLDTIDATSKDTSFLGHSYYGDNESIISDIHDLLLYSKTPEQRNLEKKTLNKLKYWTFKP